MLQRSKFQIIIIAANTCSFVKEQCIKKKRNGFLIAWSSLQCIGTKRSKNNFHTQLYATLMHKHVRIRNETLHIIYSITISEETVTLTTTCEVNFMYNNELTLWHCTHSAAVTARSCGRVWWFLYDPWCTIIITAPFLMWSKQTFINWV